LKSQQYEEVLIQISSSFSVKIKSLITRWKKVLGDAGSSRKFSDSINSNKALKIPALPKQKKPTFKFI
jgi:hypothetical protein